MRLCIAGGPRSGKTTLAILRGADLKVVPRHTDTLIGQFDWSGASLEVSRWLDEPGPWIVEGVAVARALRKWMAAHPEGKPCDVAQLLVRPFGELSKGQAAMAKGCATVWSGIAGELARRGVELLGSCR
jgi:hypothetical protein